MLADFRPNLGALRRHVERYGPAAAEDLTSQPVTARWRTQHILVPVVLRLDGPLINLTDISTRQEIEEGHIELLVEYGMDHLDVHEVTTSRRVITQTIAADLFDRGAGAVRFPSRLDGQACLAVFEKRGTVEAAGNPIALTDPPPEPLTKVTAPWGLELEPAPAAGNDHSGRA